MLSGEHLDWLRKRGIDPVIAEMFKLDTISDGGGIWLSVPYVERGRIVNHKYRMTAEKRHRMDEGAPLVLWNHDALLSPKIEHGAPVIVTEGEWDALTAIQSGFDLALSVPNGAPQTMSSNPFEERRYECIQRSRDLIDQVKTFVLATDADEAGRILAADLARLLGPERCRFVEYPDGCKDLNEVKIAHGEATVVSIINDARPYPVKGLYRLSDFPDPAPVQSIDSGIDGLGEMFPLVPGTFAVISGYAGRGKTSLILVMVAKMLDRGVPMAIASFETLPRPILERRLRAALYGCAEYDRQALQPGAADELFENRLGIIAQTPDNEDDEIDVGYLLELAKVAVLRDGIRLLIIDPWNEIEHKRRQDESETDYVGRAIRAIKRFAKLYECAVWLVAHPKKPQGDGKLRLPTLYDLSGSANFANKADYGVVVHRERMDSNVIQVRVNKVRMGLPGRTGDVYLTWEPAVSGYTRNRDREEISA
jgi:twinkle protein